MAERAAQKQTIYGSYEFGIGVQHTNAEQIEFVCLSCPCRHSDPSPHPDPGSDVDSDGDSRLSLEVGLGLGPGSCVA